MGRRNESAIEALVEITAMLPWWVGLLLAIVSYLFLHSVASMEIAVSGEVGQVGHSISRQLYKAFATLGQYVLPVIFTIGAVVSYLKRDKGNQVADGLEVQIPNTRKASNSIRKNVDQKSPQEQPSHSTPDSWSYSLIKSLE